MREKCDTLTDDEIVARVLAGDVEAFGALLARHERHVLGLVGRRVPREDAGEVAHLAFIRAYRALGGYKPGKEFKGWLSMIAMRTAMDYWRARYRRKELPMSALDDAGAERLALVAADQSIQRHSEVEDSAEARDLLAWALDRLSPEERMVLELIHIEERPVKEAAELLGWSTVNVKVRAFRARKKLRAMLERLITEEDESS